VEGKNRIAEINHKCLRRHQKGGRKSLPSALEAWTELSHRIGVVFQSLQNRSHTQKRAFAFQA
jgi:hypothetical protein